MSDSDKGNILDAMRLDAPSFYASTLQLIWGGNDCMIIASRPHPGVSLDKTNQQTGIAIEPQAILHFSAQTAKDFSILLKRGLDEYEKKFGEVETEFSRSAAAK